MMNAHPFRPLTTAFPMPTNQCSRSLRVGRDDAKEDEDRLGLATSLLATKGIRFGCISVLFFFSFFAIVADAGL